MTVSEEADRAELTSQQRGAITRAANNGGVHPGGRPRRYTVEYCNTIIELGRQGKSRAQMAAHIGVSKQTIADWAGSHPEFSDALTLALTHSQCWWEDKGQEGLEKRDFNAGLWDKNVKSRFRDDYTDRTINEHVGKDDGPIEVADTMANARRIAFMLGRAVGRSETAKAPALELEPDGAQSR